MIFERMVHSKSIISHVDKLASYHQTSRFTILSAKYIDNTYVIPTFPNQTYNTQNDGLNSTISSRVTPEEDQVWGWGYYFALDRSKYHYTVYKLHFDQ